MHNDNNNDYGVHTFITVVYLYKSQKIAKIKFCLKYDYILCREDTFFLILLKK